jgi:hypothetical protein
MNVLTHQTIDTELCGKPVKLEDGQSMIDNVVAPTGDEAASH